MGVRKGAAPSKRTTPKLHMAAQTSRHDRSAIDNVAIKWNIWLNIGHKLLRVPEESPIKKISLSL